MQKHLILHENVVSVTRIARVRNPRFHPGHVGLADLIVVGVVAVAASILGGLVGLRDGARAADLSRTVVGVANIVPVMAIGMAINNASRVVAFRHVDRMGARAPHPRARTSRVRWRAPMATRCSTDLPSRS